jgi:chromosome partitioning protein
MRAGQEATGDRARAARVVCITNQKGGVGKTTTTLSLGAAIAEAGHRVLVVDLDPQGNATTGLGLVLGDRAESTYDVLVEERDAARAAQPTAVPGLDLIASSVDLAGAEIELVPQFARENRLRDALDPIRDKYDLILIDCPPSLGLLTVNALVAADQALVPIQSEYYALEGLGQLMQTIDLVRSRLNPRLVLGGVVMTMFDARTNLSQQVADEVRRHFADAVFATIIPRTVRLSEAPSYGQPITVFDPGSRGAQTYRRLAREFERRLGLRSAADTTPLDDVLSGRGAPLRPGDVDPAVPDDTRPSFDPATVGSRGEQEPAWRT